MSLRTQYEFLFVGRDEGSFVENYAYDLGEGGENSGKIFINLEIQNNPVDAEAIGETIFDSVRKTFFADLEKDPYDRFEEAIRVVNKALHDLAPNICKFGVPERNRAVYPAGWKRKHIRKIFSGNFPVGISEQIKDGGRCAHQALAVQ